mmetsp:Transcript_136/g.336  ORF Transcript_136/g.336 Transcript_136/m.336 type:complete len:622 (+) Transcript_136:110-1975(+)|eukprot:CAMPEP_0114488410 /NCGR_PEP_ID=MMETSP0109-20121206/1312_1 /TAXON_ID=29199 /ORGANISM="Chlorarachnion reptans, Strain CCCM449" /LENGTH=621 /DNA_ID=CAMNT_0001664795 /DNA_START=32 /DNA_END=1897 /DNA_ORIENTATION=-
MPKKGKPKKKKSAKKSQHRQKLAREHIEHQQNIQNHFRLGEYTLEITTDKAECQWWFNRGLRWAFAFNHEMAIQCFQLALKFDPKNPMCHWGIGYSNGPNYNNSTGLDAYEAFEHSQKAAKLLGEKKVSGFEEELIQALTTRYTSEIINPLENPKGAEAQRDVLGKCYAEAMRRVHDKHGKNTDVAFFFAEALMITNAWKLWNLDKKTGEVSKFTLEAVEILEKHLQKRPDHPGLCHMYIHCMELSPNPEKALKEADRLYDGLVPSSGHLIHMASHIDMWVGNYKRAVHANQIAFEQDKIYIARTGHTGGIYQAYRLHNLHFLVWAAMMDGQSKVALRFADEIQSQLTEEALVDSGMVQYLEGFAMTKFMVMIRFGMWRNLIDIPIPENKEVWSSVIAIAWYSKGIAFSSLGFVQKALHAQQEFRKSLKSPFLEGRILHNNLVYDRKGTSGILNVAEAMLEGEILYRLEHYENAFKWLREAVRRDTGLPYDEPWGWMQPTSHALGALLSEQKQYKEARKVFEEDLKKYPRNLWSLRGLANCEKHLGNVNEAERCAKLYDLAAARLDVPMIAPCFCANGVRMLARSSNETPLENSTLSQPASQTLAPTPKTRCGQPVCHCGS